MVGHGDLIPLPVSYEEREGVFHFGAETFIVAPPELLREAGALAAWLSSVDGIGKVSAVQAGAAPAPSGEKTSPSAPAGVPGAGACRDCSVIHLSQIGRASCRERVCQYV
jgi:hypothetical protein